MLPLRRPVNIQINVEIGLNGSKKPKQTLKNSLREMKINFFAIGLALPMQKKTSLYNEKIGRRPDFH